MIPAHTVRWASTNGGPFVLLPRSIRNQWGGAIERDGSDYEAACAVADYLAVIHRHGSSIVVLGDEPLQTCVLEKDDKLIFVRWAYADKEEDILSAAEHLADATRDASLQLHFSEAQLVLQDAAATGADAGDVIEVQIRPGAYVVETHVVRQERTGLVAHVLRREA